VSKDWNDIEKLFNDASLGNNPSGDPVVPWSSIEKKVIRSNFFKYSFTTFNVYSLAVIIGLASTVGCLTYSTISKNIELKAKEKIIRQYQQDEMDEKAKSVGVDSIISLSDTLVRDCKIEAKQNQPLGNKVEKNKMDNEPKPAKKVEVQPDTITNVIVNKKVVKKQIFIKRTKLLRDSIVIN